MATATAQFLYSPHHCKIIHMVRHGQARHNVEAEKSIDALSSPELFDAEISPLGRQQVSDLRKQVHASGLLNRIELVLTSPLLRAMQTAVGVFGSQVPVANAENNYDQNAMETLSCPPIVALELCRDRNGVRPSDKRRTVSEYQSIFPTIDFSLMESEEDNLWNPDVRESYEEISLRMVEFLNWLWTRPEREIAIVSHGVVLQLLLHVLEVDSNPSVKTELSKRFNNCDLRSVVIVNKSLIAA